MTRPSRLVRFLLETTMLRLLTLNVGLGRDRLGPWSDRLEVAVEAIRRADPGSGGYRVSDHAGLLVSIT